MAWASPALQIWGSSVHLGQAAILRPNAFVCTLVTSATDERALGHGNDGASCTKCDDASTDPCGTFFKVRTHYSK